jgi:hypothetical protein
MVKSRYKALQLVLAVGFGIFFIVIPFIVFRNGAHPLRFKYLIFLVPLMGIFLLYSFFGRNPRVVFDSEFITAKYLFGTKVYSWAAIKDVFLSRKETYLGQYLEATVIVFGSQEKLILLQDMYRNLASMRSLIFQKAREKVRDVVPDIKEKDLLAVTRRRYSGNAYTSFNTLLIAGIAVMFIILINPLKPGPILFFPVGFILLLVLGFGTQMHYFLIDDGCLIIKNHYFPWKNKKISLQDIEEVDIETPNKRSTGLRVMSKDFNSELFGAGTLRNINREELLKDFKLIGIPVRDDR